MVVDGYRFQKGARFMALPYLASWDPRHYRAPDDFNPGRFAAGEPRPVYPFGYGTRICIGKSLAELELRLFTCRMVRAFRLGRVNLPRAIVGVLLQPNEDIVLRLTTRKAQSSVHSFDASAPGRGVRDVTYASAHVV
jgi:cytochrome P450